MLCFLSSILSGTELKSVKAQEEANGEVIIFVEEGFIEIQEDNLPFTDPNVLNATACKGNFQ